MATAPDSPPASDLLDAERLRRIVADAWDATSPVADQVDLETRQSAFRLLLEAMLQNGYEPAPEEPPAVDETPPTDQWPETDDWSIDRAFATEVQRTDAVAMSLGLEYDEAQSLYDLSGPDPRLRVDPAKLAADRQSALREITLLVCVGRGAVGLDSGTRHVREAAAAHQRPVPVGDFNACMESIPDIVLRGHSDSDNRLVRLRGTGVEAARDLAQRLARE